MSLPPKRRLMSDKQILTQIRKLKIEVCRMEEMVSPEKEKWKKRLEVV
jgi:hypothetical protein